MIKESDIVTQRATDEVVDPRLPTSAEAAAQSIVSQFKKGYRTTEFYMAAIPSIVAAVAAVSVLFGYEIDTERLVAVLAGFVPGVAYVLDRGWVKRRRLITMSDVLSNVVAAEQPIEINDPWIGLPTSALPADDGSDLPTVDEGDADANVDADGKPLV